MSKALRSIILLVTFLFVVSSVVTASEQKMTRPAKKISKKVIAKKSLKQNVCEFHLQATVATVAQQKGGNSTAPPQTDGKKRCHNNSKKNNKKSEYCRCWGKGDPKKDKCPPPPGEDKKCNNHCHTDMCDCRVKCQT